MAAEILIILLLVLANGVFAMSEIAVVSSRKARLQQRADGGDGGARRALRLAEEPARFMATVQVGITLVGVLAGAFGGARLSAVLAVWIARMPALEPYAEGLALALVVAAITYFSLVLGELVPKQVALTHPEKIAAAVAGPMYALSRAAHPMVSLLTFSTQAVVRVLGIRKSNEAPVTEEEIAVLLEQATQAGVFHEAEQDMVERVFWLGDQQVGSILVPRPRMVWLDLADPLDVNREKMLAHPHARFPVCEGGPDRPVGMVAVKDLWAEALAGRPLDLRAALKQPLYVPATTRALKLLEQFREGGVHMALVVDEYGGIQGLVTHRDIMEEIAGEVGPNDPQVVRRDDGSWLVDAGMPVDDFRDELGLDERREHDRGGYRTVGGLVVTALGRFPSPGDHVDVDGLRIEVVDMDGYRVDKVLVSRLPGGEEDGGGDES